MSGPASGFLPARGGELSVFLGRERASLEFWRWERASAGGPSFVAEWLFLQGPSAELRSVAQALLSAEMPAEAAYDWLKDHAETLEL